MAVIFIVFALTGSASVWVAKPVLAWLPLEQMPAWQRIPLRLVLIFPLYQVILVAIGTLFGQRVFFWNFVMRLWTGKRNKV